MSRTLLGSAALLLVGILHPALRAQTQVFADNFNDGDRVGWFRTGPGNLKTEDQALVLEPGGNVSAVAYFPRQTLEVGRSITLTFSVKEMSGITGLRLRFGLFDSGSSPQVAADVASDNVAGHAGYVNWIATNAGNNPRYLYKAPGVAGLVNSLSASVTDTAFFSLGASPATVTFTVTRFSDRVTWQTRVGNSAMSETTSGALGGNELVSFNAVAVGSNASGTRFVYDDLRVLVTDLASAKLPANAGQINVKLAGAVGDGVTDDTAAIQAAIDRAKGFDVRGTLYFPDGVYRVTDTLTVDSTNNLLSASVTFLGQSREGVVLKLDDGASGFGDPAQPKALLRTTGDLRPFTNVAFMNNVMDLTIDTGSGNPGAVGLIYIANNQGSVRNVLVRSGDGDGVAGIDLSLYSIPGPALLKDVEVHGFDYGVRASSDGNYHMTAEHLRLAGQAVAGFHNTRLNWSLRGILSFNRVPAIVNADAGGHVVVIDSSFQGGESAAAIVNEGFLFARNLTSSGYEAVIQQDGNAVGTSSISEFVHPTVFNPVPGAPSTSLNLPIKETPETPWDPVSQWVNVQDFGATSGVDGDNDGPAIQAAIDSMAASGKTTLYFPTGRYVLDTPVTVRGNVRRITGMMSMVSLRVVPEERTGLYTWRLEDTHHPELFIDSLFTTTSLNWMRNGIYFDNYRTQPLVLKNIQHSHGVFYKGHTTSELFIEDVASLRNFQLLRPLARPKFDLGGNRVWARNFNPEQDHNDLSAPVTLNDGGMLWVLGLKTEGPSRILTTRNGGRTELLGGTLLPGPWYQNNPAIALPTAFPIEDATASLVVAGFRGGDRSYYTEIVRETQNGTTVATMLEQVPTRINEQSFVMPLYRSADSARLPSLPGAFVQDEGAEGLLVFEAEAYQDNAPLDGYRFTPTRDPHYWFTAYAAGASGGAAMHATPDSGLVIHSRATAALSSPASPNARVDYLVRFNRAGTHYVWIRGQASIEEDANVHIGFAGVADGPAMDIGGLGVGTWGWSNERSWINETAGPQSGRATMQVPAPGDYMISMFMKADGVLIDRILITADASYTPVGEGPAPSPVAGVPAAPYSLAVQAATDTSALLVWEGAGDDVGAFVERKTEGHWEVVAQVSPGVTSALVTGLEPDTGYVFRVIAFNSAGYSEPSDELALRTLIRLDAAVRRDGSASHPYDGPASGGMTLVSVGRIPADEFGAEATVWRVRNASTTPAAFELRSADQFRFSGIVSPLTDCFVASRVVSGASLHLVFLDGRMVDNARAIEAEFVDDRLVALPTEP